MAQHLSIVWLLLVISCPPLSLATTNCDSGCVKDQGKCVRKAYTTGSVYVITNEYTCECNDGWTGAACHEPICAGSPSCSDHGLCISPSTCRCLEGWYGPACANQTVSTSDNEQNTNTYLLVSLIALVCVLLVLCVASWNKNGRTSVIYPPSVPDGSTLGPIVSRVIISKTFFLWFVRTTKRREDFFDTGCDLRPRFLPDLDPSLPTYEAITTADSLEAARSSQSRSPNSLINTEQDSIHQTITRSHSRVSQSTIPEHERITTSVARRTTSVARAESVDSTHPTLNSHHSQELNFDNLVDGDDDDDEDNDNDATYLQVFPHSNTAAHTHMTDGDEISIRSEPPEYSPTPSPRRSGSTTAMMTMPFVGTSSGNRSISPTLTATQRPPTIPQFFTFDNVDENENVTVTRSSDRLLIEGATAPAPAIYQHDQHDQHHQQQQHPSHTTQNTPIIAATASTTSTTPPPTRRKFVQRPSSSPTRKPHPTTSPTSSLPSHHLQHTTANYNNSSSSSNNNNNTDDDDNNDDDHNNTNNNNTTNNNNATNTTTTTTTNSIDDDDDDTTNNNNINNHHHHHHNHHHNHHNVRHNQEDMSSIISSTSRVRSPPSKSRVSSCSSNVQHVVRGPRVPPPSPPASPTSYSRLPCLSSTHNQRETGLSQPPPPTPPPTTTTTTPTPLPTTTTKITTTPPPPPPPRRVLLSTPCGSTPPLPPPMLKQQRLSSTQQTSATSSTPTPSETTPTPTPTHTDTTHTQTETTHTETTPTHTHTHTATTHTHTETARDSQHRAAWSFHRSSIGKNSEITKSNSATNLAQMRSRRRISPMPSRNRSKVFPATLTITAGEENEALVTSDESCDDESMRFSTNRDRELSIDPGGTPASPLLTPTASESVRV